MKVRSVLTTNLFKTGFKKLKKDHKTKEIADLLNIIEDLKNFKITSSNDNHPTTGIYKGCRDIHIRSNLILIYKYSDAGLDLVDLKLQNLGDHKDVFPKSKDAQKIIKDQLKEDIEEIV